MDSGKAGFPVLLAPAGTAARNELLAMLRSREEWTFVDREVDIRLER